MNKLNFKEIMALRKLRKEAAWWYRNDGLHRGIYLREVQEAQRMIWERHGIFPDLPGIPGTERLISWYNMVLWPEWKIVTPQVYDKHTDTWTHVGVLKQGDYYNLDYPLHLQRL